jgi:hypothetical protein
MQNTNVIKLKRTKAYKEHQKSIATAHEPMPALTHPKFYTREALANATEEIESRFILPLYYRKKLLHALYTAGFIWFILDTISFL